MSEFEWLEDTVCIACSKLKPDGFTASAPNNRYWRWHTDVVFLEPMQVASLIEAQQVA